MNYGEGSSYQNDDDSSSSSSKETYLEDHTLDYDIEWNEIMLQQRYYLQSPNSNQWGGSVPGHVVISRGRQAGATLLRNDYFSDNPTFENKFRRRFRMSRDIFLRIRKELIDHSNIWKKSYDACHQLGLSSYQKMCASIQFLAYGTAADSFEQYFRIGVSYDTWIWNAYFGLPGSNNDVNVLHKEDLFQDLTNGRSLPPKYSIKGRDSSVGYYLADGIYPKWSTLVQLTRLPQNEKEKYFLKQHNAYRKNVEQAFGVLQSRFVIIIGAARLWNKHTLHDVMSASIIMHNMIVETERTEYLNNYIFEEFAPPMNEDYESAPFLPSVNVMRDNNNIDFLKFLARHRELMNRGEHNELRRRLVAHMWDNRTLE